MSYAALETKSLLGTNTFDNNNIINSQVSVDGTGQKQEIVNALLSFNQESVLLSGNSYATCSLIISSIKYLEKQLNKRKSETPHLIVILKSHLLESLLTYKDSYELENNSFLL